jgi:hypothetical protein
MKDREVREVQMYADNFINQNQNQGEIMKCSRFRASIDESE